MQPRLTSLRLTYRGEHYRYDDVPMELAPLQRPYPPLWYATSNVDSVPWAASQGMNFVGLGPAEAYRAFVEKYRAVWPAHRDDPRRLNAHVPTPRIGINRQAADQAIQKVLEQDPGVGVELLIKKALQIL